MKALTPCKRQYFRMLGCCGYKAEILHLYYKLDWLQKEIEKRSSYLGRFRKTEQAQHLLDLLAMTNDEEDLFYPFAKAAMADVFDGLSSMTPDVEKAYLFNEGKTTKVLTPIPDLGLTKVMTGTSTGFRSGRNELYAAISVFGNDIDISDYDIRVTLNIPYTIEYRIKGTSQTVTEMRSIDYTFKLSPYTQDHYNAFESVIEVDLASATSEFTAEQITGIGINPGDDITEKVVSIEIKAINPETYVEGDYVMLDDQLYIANEAGDVNDITPLVKQEYDFRQSIHYVMHYPATLNRNMIEPLDTAVFEALVNRIIYKWLVLSYPDEAAVYQSQYEEALTQVRHRISTPKSAIVYKTPRII
mgnify:CR=1 FL=1